MRIQIGQEKTLKEKQVLAELSPLYGFNVPIEPGGEVILRGRVKGGVPR